MESAIRFCSSTRKITAALFLSLVFNLPFLAQTQNSTVQDRPRARDMGVKVGILPTGTLNAITDVTGVAVGNTTIIRGEHVRTGVTALLPPQGSLCRDSVAGGGVVGDGGGSVRG